MKGYSEQQISALKEETYTGPMMISLHEQTEMVEHKLNQTVEKLEKLLAKEQAARL
ncbi:hypothetical protein B296_00017038 [Ensete ventricosum]|uniref:Uncharacterized protein n=1 Tax=Ensete ventricosum TaxID=4639 RepID=A0A426ZFG0_ENSVE|nr:hypothetical protein B296_00017038 [Ensete ventricosum]